jgi:hypothetical protein
MSLFNKWFKKEESKEKEEPLPWIEAANNPWSVRLLDLRPITQTVMSTSTDPLMAANAVSYSQEDGTSFIGQTPADNTLIETNISFPIDIQLAPGVLFVPEEMEHKWAIFFHNDKIIFVRSWLRQVFVIAETRQQDNTLIITNIKGKFVPDEEPAMTIAILKFLLISINETVPAPLPSALTGAERAAALWAFSTYGKIAHVGIFDADFDINATKPLRSHSLLHIAVARKDMQEVEKQFNAGTDLNYLASDGLAPLHWAVSTEGTDMIKYLLTLGADPNVTSVEGATPIMNTVQSKKPAQLLLLLEWGADVNAKDHRGFTALHRAAEMDLEEIVNILLESDADISIVAEGHTALSLATMRGNTNIITLLK